MLFWFGSSPPPPQEDAEEKGSTDALDDSVSQLLGHLGIIREQHSSRNSPRCASVVETRPASCVSLKPMLSKLLDRVISASWNFVLAAYAKLHAS